MGRKTYTVDRIEENIAVVFDENEKKSDIPVSNLPDGIKEGDILSLDEQTGVYIIDKAKTAQVKSNIEERFKKLFKK